MKVEDAVMEKGGGAAGGLVASWRTCSILEHPASCLEGLGDLLYDKVNQHIGTVSPPPTPSEAPRQGRQGHC